MALERLITPAQFDMQMERLSSVFGDKAFNEQRLAIIWKHVESLPQSSFIKIVDQFLGSSRFAPLPNDFKEAAGYERRSIGSGYTVQDKPFPLDCDLCMDLGIVRTKLKEYDAESLMKCTCKKGLEHNSKVAAWHNRFSEDWNKKPCPIEWFKPDLVRNEKGEIQFQDSLNSKIEFWRAKLNIAEQFWSHHNNLKTWGDVL